MIKNVGFVSETIWEKGRKLNRQMNVEKEEKQKNIEKW